MSQAGKDQETKKMNFSGKVAVITGAGNGLGRSYALFLASRGAKVLVNDLGTDHNGQGLSSEPAERVVAEIKKNGGQAVANFESVAEREGAQKIIDDCLKAFGTVDILINNAGILRDKTLLKMPLDDFELIHRVHLLGSVYVTRAALPIMKEKQFGRIVLTTSTSGLFGVLGQTNYSSAKLGVIGFMNSLKQEGARYNIKVNSIAPLAHTRMSEPAAIFPEKAQKFLGPDLVTPLVAYLVSDACTGSGDIISVGGGYFAKVQIMEGLGVRFDPREEVTPEMIAANYQAISDMAEARHFKTANDQIQAALKPFLD